MPHRDVRSLVLSVDDEKLSEQVLRQLGKFMPGKDEVCVCVCMHACVRVCLCVRVCEDLFPLVRCCN